MGHTRRAGLDGFRGAAAFSILLLHLGYAPHGYLSVDAFFILSGFVISLRYEDRFRNGLTVRGFMLGRFKSLLPVFWCSLLPTAAVYLYLHCAPDRVFKYLLKTMFFIPGIGIHDLTYSFNPPSWFLVSIIVMYAIYAAALNKISNIRLSIYAIILWVSMVFVGIHSVNQWNIGFTTKQMLIYSWFRAVPGFCAGIILFRIHRAKLITHLPRIPPCVLLVVWLGLMVLPCPVSLSFYDPCVAIICAPLMILLLIQSGEDGPGWFRFASRISYPLYVSQWGIILLQQRYMAKYNPLIVTGISIVAAVLLAWAIAGINTRIQTRISHNGTAPARATPAE